MERDIEIEGLKIHYDETGPQDAPAVILMHGWGCQFSTVASIANILSPGMHVYNIDLPGHGKSDEPKDVWGVEEYSRLIEKFIAILNIDSPALIGHSYGGRVAIILASRNDIPKMMLVDAAGIKPKRSLKYYCKIYWFKAMKKLLPTVLGNKKGGEVIEKMRGKAGSSDYRTSTPMMRAVMSKSINQDLKSYMPKIKASTLLVWGENDTATPLSDGKTMERLISDSGLVVFPGCGHYSFLDNPGGFRAVTREFFKEELNRKELNK